MNNLIQSITNWNSRVISSLLFGLLILGNFINHWSYFIVLISMASIISFIRYSHDKKWLKDAEKYIRIAEKRPIWKRILAVVWIVGWTLLVVEFKDFLDQYIHQKTFSTLLILLLPLSFENHFQKFVASVKSFEEGIQLPGRNQEIIPWREIYEFTFEDQLSISSSKGEHTFRIDKEDPEHANGMISDWKQRNGRRTSKFSD